MRMRSHNFHGFTLVEMLITITVLGILTAVGIPSFKSILASQRVKTAATTLQAYLNLTRSEALKRNTSVTLSPISSTWNSGWKIVDPSNTSSALKQTSAYSSLTITCTSSCTSVIYQSSGRVKGSADATFKISASGTSDIRCVEVDLSGISIVTSSGC